MSSVDNEYYEYLMSQDKSDLAIEIMNLEPSSSNNRIAEFIKENDQLKQQLHDLPNKIVEEIKLQLFNHFKVKNIEEYGKLPLIDSLFTADTVIEILDTILKKYGGGNE